MNPGAKPLVLPRERCVKLLPDLRRARNFIYDWQEGFIGWAWLLSLAPGTLA